MGVSVSAPLEAYLAKEQMKTNFSISEIYLEWISLQGAVLVISRDVSGLCPSPNSSRTVLVTRLRYQIPNSVHFYTIELEHFQTIEINYQIALSSTLKEQIELTEHFFHFINIFCPFLPSRKHSITASLNVIPSFTYQHLMIN